MRSVVFGISWLFSYVPNGKKQQDIVEVASVVRCYYTCLNSLKIKILFTACTVIGLSFLCVLNYAANHSGLRMSCGRAAFVQCSED